MTTDADKVRFLAELAGWHIDGSDTLAPWDYPNSNDAIARDLLPILREKGWEYLLEWDGENHLFHIDDGVSWKGSATDPEPARAAFEAIYEALGGEK